MALYGLRFFTNIASPVMFCGMLRNCHNLKVFNSVIKFVSVDVVDYFSWFKRSFNIFFHNNAMVVNLFSITKNEFISTIANRTGTRRSFFSMQSSIHAKSLIMNFTKTFTETLPVTSFYFANIRGFTVRTLDCICSAILALKHIMILTKTFSKLRFVASFDFANKIFDTIRASFGFLFHNNNIKQLDRLVKQNLR